MPMSSGNVLVVCGKVEFANELVSLMLNNGYSAAEYAMSANEARRKMNTLELDLIIVNTPLPDDYGCDFVLDISEKTDAGIVVLVKHENLNDMQLRLEKVRALILPKPISRTTLVQSSRFALDSRKSIQALTNERNSLQKRAEERKTVEKAKWLLVEKLNMTEALAHRYIQKAAMDQRLSQIKVAEEIILHYE